MATAVIVGGSVAGLAAALALGEHGYSVTVLDRAAPPPTEPVEAAVRLWRRPTVPQAGHSHQLTSRGLGVLLSRAPEVVTEVCEAGGRLLDLLVALPPAAAGPRRQPDDSDLVVLATRRCTLELVMYRHVCRKRNIAVRHGVTVVGLDHDDAMNRVTGVLTDRGREPAEVVIDATGRTSAARRWLAGTGRPVPGNLIRPAGLRTFSRFYRRPGGHQPGPLNRGNAAGLITDHYAGVLHPGDGDTFSVAIGALPQDHILRGLRDPALFTAIARRTPWIRDWIVDAAVEPISPVRVATGPNNVLSGLAASVDPPVSGLFPVGDAACTTNPLYGRGMSLAIEHAYALADLLAGATGGGEQAVAGRLTRAIYGPWFDQAGDDDAQRIAVWQRTTGAPAPTGAPRGAVAGPPRPGRPSSAEIAAAARVDAAVWRALARVSMGLRLAADVFDDPEFRRRVRGAARPLVPPAAAPGRAELVNALAEAAAR